VARHEVISVMKKYISRGSYDTIVVGLPHDLYGKRDKQLNKTKDFIEKLSRIFPDIAVV
jgi:RNase H-fold protein (predicted Holliday junction resolvase)